MNELQIEYFLAVARNLSFTKTAEEFYVTQPAVSKHISLLEKELDVVLFDRNNKSILLTDAGKLFQTFFLESIKAFEDTKDEAKALESNRKGHIRLACLEGWNISGFYPELLDSFRRKYPNIEVNLEIYSIKGLIQALKAEKVDAIMTLGVTLTDIEGITSVKLAEIPKILLYSSNHKFAGKPGLSIADFKNDVFFIMSAEEVAYASRLVHEYCEPYGFKPKIQCVRNIESMNVYVQNGLGVAISDFWSREKEHTGFGFLELKETHTISLGWLNKEDNDNIHILTDELKLLLDKRYPATLG